MQENTIAQIKKDSLPPECIPAGNPKPIPSPENIHTNSIQTEGIYLFIPYIYGIYAYIYIYACNEMSS